MDHGPLRTAVDAFQRGDAAAAASQMDPDVVWHSPGRRQPAAGTHRGLDSVKAAFGAIATAPGELELEVVDALPCSAAGHEIVLYRHRRTREGASLDAAIALVARVEGGRLAEVWEYIYELFEFDEFYGGPDGSDNDRSVP